jgi:hypothetical protein
MHLSLKSLGRLLGVGIAVIMPLAASAPAHAAATLLAAPQPQCLIHSNPSMVEMGFGPTSESSIADIIQVECRPIYSQSTVTIDATQLNNACHGTLSWAAPPFPPTSTGSQFTVTLDNDGGAIAAVWGGPSCAPSTNRISASLEVPPFTTVATKFQIDPPRNTKPGITANPATEVEDAVYSSVATVIQVEFPSVQAEKFVNIKSHELFSRCASALTWVGPEEVILGVGVDNVTVQLDNNGNAFVVVIAGPSCASGTSTLTADLTTVPYTTFTGAFTILSPRPTCTPKKCT